MSDINNKGADEMTVKEIARLIDWLKSQGFTAEQINECIKYIANSK
jgi:DNA-binding transcriptional regulator YhcF (GntR family)